MANRRSGSDLSFWGHSDVQRYEVAKHGPDGVRFLDPHLYRWMDKQNLVGHEFLDIGGGTGPWTEFAMDQGVNSATLLDLNPAMVDRARERLSVAGVISSDVRLDVGNAANLPYDNETFNRLVSINVGCNLPPNVFRVHFKEAYRVAMKGGKFLVAAPDSLCVPFTNCLDPVDVQRKIDKLWESMFAERDPKKIIEKIKNLLRGTFVLDSIGKPVLVREAKKGGKSFVSLGQPIIRRIPGLAVDNNFHTATECIDAARKAGWQIVAQHKETFASPEERRDFNKNKEEKDQLGPEYESRPAFLVMELEKPV